jgi:hypothetical protein
VPRALIAEINFEAVGEEGDQIRRNAQWKSFFLIRGEIVNSWNKTAQDALRGRFEYRT